MRLSEEKIEIKFQNLIQQGKEILSVSGWDGRHYSSHPSDIDYQRWRSESLNLISRVCGRSSVHYDAMQKIVETELSRHNSYFFKDCMGIMEAAYSDYRDGMLSEIKYLVRADLLDDLISQAEMLLKSGYYIAAASLAGAVLEDTMRKMCEKNIVEYPEKTNINSLNVLLYKAELYDKLIQKEITAKADLRNSADHGIFKDVREQDVEDMIKWIRRFVSEYLY